MATNDAGLYLSTGIQNSGATKCGASGEIEIYSGGEKIYPRFVQETLSNDSFGGWNLYTWRTGNDKQSGTYNISNTDIKYRAIQGAKSQTYYYGTDKYHISWGHIQPNSMRRISNSGLEVLSASIKCKSFGIGIHGQKTFTFRVSRSDDLSANNGGDLTGTIYTVEVNDIGQVEFYLEDNATLHQLLKEFLSEGSCLMLYNGETQMDISAAYNDGTGYGSANYAGIIEFSIESLVVKYQP